MKVPTNKPGDKNPVPGQDVHVTENARPKRTSMEGALGTACPWVFLWIFLSGKFPLSEGVRGIATPSFRRLLLKAYRPVTRLEGRAVTTSIRSDGNSSMQESRYTTEKIFHCGMMLALGAEPHEQFSDFEQLDRTFLRRMASLISVIRGQHRMRENISSANGGTGGIRAKIYSKRICPSLSPMFSVRLDGERRSSKGDSQPL